MPESSRMPAGCSSGYDLFVSYSSADAFWVERWLLPQLSQAGLIVCTEHDGFELGVPRMENFERVLDQCRHFLLVLSPAWLHSEWHTLEALLVQSLDPAAHQRRLLPLLLHSCQPPRRIAQLAAADFRDLEQWDDQLQRLIDAVRGVRMLPAAPANAPNTALLSDQAMRNRRRMLDKVRDFWVHGVLDRSRNDAALIALGLEFVPEAVAHPWRMLVQQPSLPQRDLPPGTRISTVFDSLHGELLILGDPGCGKTTLLLELTSDLLARAEHDQTHPIPVVFTLSTWAEQRRPLAAWLADELNARYDVPRQVAQEWVASEQILPLLDGFDEVTAEYRTLCLEAINAFRREHGLLNLVVCSRLADYTMLDAKLKLAGAVLVQPLTAEQIDICLASAGDRLQGLRQALREQPVLQELATSPLLLSLLILTYQGQSAAALPSAGSSAQWQEHLFRAYVDSMFARRSIDTRYSRAQTIRWLSWLARALVQQSQTVFFLERLQPSWLPTRRARLAYVLLDRAVIALVVGLGYWLTLNALLWLTGQTNPWPTGVRTSTAAALIAGFFGNGTTMPTIVQQRFSRLLVDSMLGGALIGLLSIILSRLQHGVGDFVLTVMIGVTAGSMIGRPYLRARQIAVVERLRWSWQKALRLGLTPLLVGALSSLCLGLSANQGSSLGSALINGLSLGLIFLMLSGMLLALVGDEVETRTVPNQGMRRSAGSALFFGLSFGLVLWEVIGVGAGLMWALIVGLAFGGSACLSHLALRLVLWRSGALPLQSVRFLDYAAERIFLRKVGGGYIFIHRRLLEYFAALEDTPED